MFRAAGIVSFLALLGAGCSSTFEHRVKTTAERDALWSTWTEVSEWPSWDTELESASLDGEFRQGARGSLKPKDGPESSFEVTSVDEGRAYTYEVNLPLASLELERTSEPANNGIWVTHRVSFNGFLGWFFALFLQSHYEEVLPDVMEKLVQRAEERS